MKKFLLFILLTCSVMLSSLSSVNAYSHESVPGVQTMDYITLEMPLFSPQLADIPIAMVNEVPITLRELEASLSQQKNPLPENQGEKEKEYLRILNRLITSRLIVQEAINMGLDDTDSYKKQVDNYKFNTLQKELIASHLKELEPDPVDVEEVYKQISREVNLSTIIFEFGSDAQKFLDEVKDGDFDELAKQYVEEGKATEEKGEQYVKLKDLLTQVGQQVYSMKIGDVSNIFRDENGFVMFRLVDARFVEDPEVKKEAVRITLDTLKKQKAMEYSNALVQKYVDFDEELYNQLDFDADLKELQQDKRVLATVKSEEPKIITVEDLAKNLKFGFFHGADKAQKLKMINERKDSALSNILFRYTSELEANNLGLDQTEEFKRKVETFERTTLFSAFMNKVLLPDVQLAAEEVRSYFDEHIEEYMSPLMLRMNSLVFNNRQDAESSLDKLRKGADFSWVSANASGLVDPETEGILSFDRNLLSLTALPEDLQQVVKDVQQNDFLLYAQPESDFYYLLVVEDVFPPVEQPYDKVRDEVAKIAFNMKTEKLLDEWIVKLKEVYPTEIFLKNSEE